MLLRTMPLATLLGGCVFAYGTPQHAADVPAGLPFEATVAVSYLDPMEPYGASGCVALPASWTLEVDAADAPFLAVIDPVLVLSAVGAPPGATWRCFSASTGHLRLMHLWITPDAEGTFNLDWVVEDTSWYWYNDRRRTQLMVHAPRPDEDLDGVDAIAEGGTDCDDNDATRYPGAAELCDGLDQDCDEIPDNGAPDLDADGLCDDRDFRLPVLPLTPGVRTRLYLQDAAPLSTVTLVLSTRRSGAPVCLPGVVSTTGAPICTDLLPAQYIQSSAAGANGATGWFSVPVPRNAPLGATVYAQAFWTLNGVGDATPVVTTTVTAHP